MDQSRKVVLIIAGLTLVLVVVALQVLRGMGNGAPTGQATGASNKTLPNVLLVIADDMGVDKLGVYAQDVDGDYANTATALPLTPTLDGLAAQGVRFTDAWANPSCSPTRATLYTGLHAFRHGVGTAIGGPMSTSGLDPDLTTLAEIMGHARYESALFGKWHLGEGDVPDTWGTGEDWIDHLGETVTTDIGPAHHGYDMFGGSLFGALDVDGGGYESWTLLTTVHPGVTRVLAVEETTYATSQQVDDAARWIRSRTRPWFVTLAFNAPHSPWEAPPEDCRYTTASPTTDVTAYQAMVECMDMELGRLIDSIPELRDTVILFVGDNGTDASLAEEVFDDGRGKNTLYESGVRVPLIVADGWTLSGSTGGMGPGPGASGRNLAVHDAGREVADPVHVVDLFATIGELAGADTSTGVDSTSLVPLLRDTSGDVPVYAYTELYMTEGTGSAALRYDAHKLIVTVERQASGLCRSAYELYNVVSDRHEWTDLSASDPDTLATLTALIDELAASEEGAWLDVSDC